MASIEGKGQRLISLKILVHLRASKISLPLSFYALFDARSIILRDVFELITNKAHALAFNREQRKRMDEVGYTPIHLILDSKNDDEILDFLRWVAAWYPHLLTFKTCFEATVINCAPESMVDELKAAGWIINVRDFESASSLF